MECIKIDRDQGIAVVTIDRPKVLNALNNQVFEDLTQALAELREDDGVGAVIVTGSGEKAFVAGADIKEIAATDILSAKKLSERGQSVFRTIECFPKPVIAAINGFALGGGCELALACHVRIGSSNARLGLPEVGLGLIPGYGGTQRLTRLVGKGIALEMILTGDMIPAERAKEIGLINHVTEPEQLLETSKKIASKMLRKGPVAIRFAIEAVQYGADLSEEQGERLEAALFGIVAATGDAKEGLSAFLEKRQTDFKGR